MKAVSWGDGNNLALNSLLWYCRFAGDRDMSADSHKITELAGADRNSLALEGFFAIMHHWKADNPTARRILGSPADRTFYEWKKGKAPRLTDDTLRRIGYVAGIWKALQIVYSNPETADGWVNRPNDFLSGQTPLQRMSAGDMTDLAAVRMYVDSARAPWS
jgi:uncharacterized protein (DUF2384 family)